MLDYKTLRDMQTTYLAASQNRTPWEGDRSLCLAERISELAGHLADSMIPIAPPPPQDDEHVAIGCSLFSDHFKMKSV